MRRNSEAFELLVESVDYDDRTRIAFRSHAFDVHYTVDLRGTWSQNGADPRRLADYIERLVGRTLNEWFDLRVSNGREMAQALMPHWEREIHRHMERLEYEGRHRRRDHHFYEFDPRGYMAWDLATEPEDPKAKQKARELLIRNLDAGQEKSFKKDGEFRVTAKDGKVYTIKTARSFNVVGPDGAKYCGQLRDAPVEDQMLAQKLLLEHEPDKFFKNANVSPAQGATTAAEITMRYQDIIAQTTPWRITDFTAI